MEISEDGLNLIKRYEGLKLRAYLCPANVWTIGYGHTHQVKKGDVITEEMATEYLKKDVRHAQRAIERLVKVSLAQYQFDALVSFIYNCGVGAFKKSTLLRMLNQGKYEAAENQFQRWNKAGGRVLRGLVRRRNDEAELFSGDYISVAAQDWQKSFKNEMPQAIDEPKVKTMLNSKTNISSCVGIAGVAATQFDQVNKVMDGVSEVAAKGGDLADRVGAFSAALDWKMIVILGMVALFGFVIYERKQKVDQYGL